MSDLALSVVVGWLILVGSAVALGAIFVALSVLHAIARRVFRRRSKLPTIAHQLQGPYRRRRRP